MSYLPVSADNFLADLLKRKEIYSLKYDAERDFRDPPGALPADPNNLKIHSHQLFIRYFLNPNTPYMRLHLTHGCHGINTKILMHDGSIKLVQDVRRADMLMGDDGAPRHVIGLCRGQQQMVDIMCDREIISCNMSHIITVMRADCLVAYDISVGDYLNLEPHMQKFLFMIKMVVDFPTSPGIDHYAFGRYLVIRDKDAIPHRFLCSNTMDRFMLLMGIVDAGGVKTTYTYIKVRCAIDHADLRYLCNSLGLSVRFGRNNAHIRRKYIVNDGHVWTLHTGITAVDNFAMVKRTLHRFKVCLRNHADYYGFELDANGRYLLDNFIVTHNTGTGKTLAALSAAIVFNEFYVKDYDYISARMQAGRRDRAVLDQATPSIFVLGFGGTKTAFMRDLLKYPEFGFITMTERREFVRRQKSAMEGTPDDVKRFKEYYTYIKKRITNKAKKGFFKFYGYDEFVNRLFVSDTVNLAELEADVSAKIRQGETITLEQAVNEQIKLGHIRINTELLSMFHNSIMICDEIHNTYNMNMKNNRGVAIQFLLDTVENMRFLSLSATPINNSPTEVVELVNYLVPKDQKITKKEMFVNSKTLYPGKLELLGHLVRGRVSFFQDVNIKYYPSKNFMGESIVLPRDIMTLRAGSTLPYLRFCTCPMSKFHQHTLMSYFDTRNDGEVDDRRYQIIPTDGHAIYDIALPNPEDAEIGLFRSGDIRSKIQSAPQAWKDAHQIDVRKASNTSNAITGDFMSLGNIGKYSTKYQKLLEIVLRIIKRAEGEKIMIYHNMVRSSGVIFIQEMLKANKILDDQSEPVDETLCCICGREMEAHTKIKTHSFHPVRFIVAHADVDKSTLDQLLTKYNAPANAHGINYMIFVGSKIIKESYEIRDTQHLIVASAPISIPELEQIIGRVVRTDSHINLEPEQRRVSIHILLSTINTDYAFYDPVSPELYRYVDKILDYRVIQQIGKVLNENSIDGAIHRDIIMSRDVMNDYFPDGQGNGHAARDDILGYLYYEPNELVPQYKLRDLNLSTFKAYKYYEQEIATISYIIKKIYTIQPVWSYDDLWARVREPPVGVEVNPRLFAEENFVIALNNLVQKSISILTPDRSDKESVLIDQVFDYSDRYIYVAGVRHKLTQIDKYYIIFPVAEIPTNPLNMVFMEYAENVRDKERLMIKQTADPSIHTVVDVETYLRYDAIRSGLRLNIDNYLKETRVSVNYVITRNRFMQNVSQGHDIDEFLFKYGEQFQKSFIEEAISANEDKPIYADVIGLMNNLGVIVYCKEVKKYKDTVKQFSYDLSGTADNTPMGYETAKSIRLYDHSKGWFEVNKTAMNRHMAYKENDVIIGYFESAEDHMRFKLRKPAHVIKQQTSKRGKSKTDARTIEKGVVCETKNKHDILAIAASLGISASKLNKADVRIKKICGKIRTTLMQLEIKERAKDTRYKYLYSWWDEIVVL